MLMLITIVALGIMTLIANMAVAAVEVMVSKYVEEKNTTMSSDYYDDLPPVLNPQGDDYAGYIDTLYRHGNSYLIWLIII
jgi:hypothetical protein